ncbi:MAG: cpaE [Rhodocyclaceae bacterium]|nr:cpaE [Rhodocyclaceae bacterium]
MEKIMKATILMHKADTQEALRKILADADIECEVAVGSLRQFASLGAATRDLLIAETDGSRSELAVVERLATQHPQLPIVLAAADPGREFLLEAMQLGVLQVLALPFKPEAVREVLARLRQRLGPSSVHQGKVIVFQPSKGGSGATFLAANLAYAIAQQGKRVALIDLNLQFGDAVLHVSDSNAGTSVADVVQQLQRLDGEFLMSSMVRVTPNFSVLPSPDSPDKAVGVRPEGVFRLIEVARGNFDYVIVDVERTLDPVSIRALDCADSIMVVLQLTLPFIRDAKRLMSVFDSLGYPRGKVRLIVNRYQKGGEIGLADVEGTLGADVAYTVPNSFNAVAASVNQGKPIVSLDPNDRVSKTLVEMAARLEKRSSTPAGGWLSRLFKKAA